MFLKNGHLIEIASGSADGYESVVAVLRTADATALRAAILALDPRIVIEAMMPSEGSLKFTITLPVDPRLRGALAKLLAGQGELYEFSGAESALEAALAAALADHSRP